jgi:hypothetical protein
MLAHVASQVAISEEMDVARSFPLGVGQTCYFLSNGLHRTNVVSAKSIKIDPRIGYSHISHVPDPQRLSAALSEAFKDRWPED